MTPATAASPQLAAFSVEFGIEIPMRDGTILVGNLYRPDRPDPAPGLLCLTPYGVDYLHPDARFYASRGFATLTVDIRGRGDSPGSWTMYGEAEDGVDCIAFLAAHPCCTGRVGLFGASYSAVIQWLIAVRRPPGLAAIAPIAAPLPGLDGKMSNGIPWTYNLRWMTLTAGSGTRFAAFADEALWNRVFWRHHQAGAPFAGLAPPGTNLHREFNALAQSMFDPAHWARCTPTDAELDAIDIPVLTITGLSDDCLRGAHAMTDRHRRSASPSAAAHRLVVGPWNHAGSRMPPLPEGAPGWRSPDEAIPRQPARAIAAAFYAQHLADAPPTPFLTVPNRIFVLGREQWAGLETLEHHPTKGDHPSDKDARKDRGSHHPTKGDHPSDKDARKDRGLHHPTKGDHPSDKDARKDRGLHHPTKGDHPSDKDARQNIEPEQRPISASVPTRPAGAPDAPTPWPLHLAAPAQLTPDPVHTSASITFVSDPADDRFARLEATGAVGNTWAAWCGAQPFEDGFARHLCGAGATFLSQPLPAPRTILGTPSATLFLELDVPDADLALILSEIEPDGRAVTLSTDLVRLRYRNGLAHPVPMTQGIHRLTFTRFRLASRQLRPFSRLRLVIRAVNSIHFQRNMHTGEDLRTESIADARPARVTLHLGAACPSHVVIPLATQPTRDETPPDDGTPV